MYIGVSGYNHESAAALVDKNGVLIDYCKEEDLNETSDEVEDDLSKSTAEYQFTLEQSSAVNENVRIDLANSEDGLLLEETDGDNILMENVAGRLLVEAPYEGVKISDISTLYGNIPISELEINEGMRTSLTFSASVQSGA